MIPSDLAARLRMLTEASFFDSEPPVQGTAKVREIQARLPQLLPGQQFTATLERPLPDGTFQALVGGKNYTLALNHTAKAGDTLELIVTRNAPNAVFAQLADPSAATAARAANDGRPNLSAAGRLISFVLTGQPAPQPVSLADGKPLLSSPPTAATAMATANAATQSLAASGTPAGSAAASTTTSTTTSTAASATTSETISAAKTLPASSTTTQSLALALRQTLSQSGLFYEAHQLKWLSGKLDTASLLREPQGQQSPNLAAAAASMLAAPPNLAGQALNTAGMRGMSGTLAGLLLGLGLAPGEAEVDADGNPLQARTASEGATQPAGGRTTASSMAERTAFAMGSTDDSALESQQKTALNRGAAIPDRLMPVVHQQLDAMATQNYVLLGQAWPGQPFRWEIEDPWREGNGEAAADTPQEWNSTLSVTLPNLGGVEARLQLSAQGVSIRLLADEAQTVTALDDAREQLRAALEAANLPLTGFVAEQRDGG